MPSSARRFLIHLRRAFHKGKLQFHGELAPLAQPAAFEALCQKAGDLKWVVYAKRPFGGPEQVLKYLARYTHRVAISNQRLLSLEDGRVTFQWKDYAAGNQTKTMTLEALGVHSPLSPPCAARRLCPHPPLRIPRQPHTEGKLALCHSLLSTTPIAVQASADSPVSGDSTLEALFPGMPCLQGRPVDPHSTTHRRRLRMPAPAPDRQTLHDRNEQRLRQVATQFTAPPKGDRNSLPSCALRALQKRCLRSPATGYRPSEPRWSTIFATESSRQQMLLAAIIKQAPLFNPHRHSLRLSSLNSIGSAHAGIPLRSRLLVREHSR